MNNEYLRHTLATIAYRFQKSVRDADNDFGNFQVGHQTRTPGEIVHHMTEVMWFMKLVLLEQHEGDNSLPPLTFQPSVERFHDTLAECEFLLKKEELKTNYSKKLLQGPLSDVLTHIGQISLLSGIAGRKIKGENFAAAEVQTGNVSANQALHN